MPSHLTRHVFRKLLANELVTHHGCLRQSGLGRRRPIPRAVVGPAQHVQTRTFFNFFRKPERDVKEADIDPGLEKMMEYSKMERLRARLPPREDVAVAFDKFMSHRNQAKVAVEDEHVQHALRAFRYIEEVDGGILLSARALRRALHALTRPPKQPSDAHEQLALGIFEQSRTRGIVRSSVSPMLMDVIRACNVVGKSHRAREILLRFLEPNTSSEVVLQNTPGDETITQSGEQGVISHWNQIMRGFMIEGNEAELLRTLEIMEKRDTPLTSATAMIMAEFYSRTGDVTAARQWYDRFLHLKTVSEGAAETKRYEGPYEQLLGICMEKKDIAWGQSLIKDIVDDTPSKALWDLVLVWAAYLGKGPDELDRMMGVMESASNGSNNDGERTIADVETINKLVEYAISRKDPYAAERFIELGRKRNIRANAKTLVLQMDYRLSTNDIDGALVAYKHLQSYDLSANADVPSVNRLIRAMCTSGRHDFESIMNVAADLSDRRARFAPQTVASLSMLHLSRGELHDVVDLLNTHVFHYSSREREKVRMSMVDFVRRPQTSTAQAWDTYSITRQIFDELARGARTLIMEDFFRRDRPDMAVHIFNHMRTHTRSDTVATVETYVTCLKGIARSKDEESLETVHNQLKLDFTIEPNTRLSNALMLAFTACGHPRRALAFWDDIAASQEGPNINSIHLALRACEIAPWGDRKAREIWEKLQKTGIESSQDLWTSYVAALAGNGCVADAIRELEAAHDKGLAVVNTFM